MILSDPVETAPSAEDAAPVVAILEDDLLLANLAAELSSGLGLRPMLYATPAALLDAVRTAPPAILVLDWRLENELGAAAFMAVRHRHRALPVVCWTASPTPRLPQMIHADPMTQVVDKAAGATSLESALRRAVAVDVSAPLPGGAADVRYVPHPT